MRKMQWIFDVPQPDFTQPQTLHLYKVTEKPTQSNKIHATHQRMINNLKHSGWYTYTCVEIKTIIFFRSLYSCVYYDSHNKEMPICLYTIHSLFFTMRINFVLCDMRNSTIRVSEWMRTLCQSLSCNYFLYSSSSCARANFNALLT